MNAKEMPDSAPPREVCQRLLRAREQNERLTFVLVVLVALLLLQRMG